MAPRLRQFQRYGMRRQWFRAGHTIYRPGDPCANLYIVLSGRVAITSPNPTSPVPPAASGDPNHEPSTPNNSHSSSSIGAEMGYEFFPGGNQWSGRPIARGVDRCGDRRCVSSHTSKTRAGIDLERPVSWPTDDPRTQRPTIYVALSHIIDGDFLCGSQAVRIVSGRRKEELYTQKK
jgi:hypothetical protein